MKKILLSCACCLLALGLVTACEDEVIDDSGDAGDKSSETEGEDTTGGEEETVYKLGVLDEANYTYRYFNGAASGNFLATTTSWDEAVELTIEPIEVEDEEVDIAVSFSFVDSEGATKYISWSDSTKVDIADEPYAWCWVEELSVFAGGSTNGRVLVLYTDGSIRAYAQNETNLAYPHMRIYTKAQENPTAPEVPELEMVTTLISGESYYLGSVDEESVHLIDGSLSNNRLGTTMDYTKAVLVTVTSADSNVWTMKIGESTVYAYYSSGNFNLELSSGESSHSGVSTFSWNETASTLTSTVSDGSTYAGSYLEFYSNLVCLYGYKEGDTTLSSPAHFYQVATTQA